MWKDSLARWVNPRRRSDGQAAKKERRVTITAYEPLLIEIFKTQLRYGIPDWELQEKTGFGRAKIAKLRHPQDNEGKHVTLEEIRTLGRAVGLELIVGLVPAKFRPVNPLLWIKGCEEI